MSDCPQAHPGALSGPKVPWFCLQMLNLKNGKSLWTPEIFTVVLLLLRPSLTTEAPVPRASGSLSVKRPNDLASQGASARCALGEKSSKYL